jgi:hypothetical protein
MAEGFQSPDEFREVMEKTFTLMAEEPEFRATPQRFEFPDLELVANVRDGELQWGDVDWEPRVRMTMSSETANRYFQGKEIVPEALVKRTIKTGGDVKAALAILPIAKPVFARYRELVESDYPHLVV